MIETKSAVIMKEELTHKFYCDKCGVYLGESIECDDGYFERRGEFKHEFYIDDHYGWYKKCSIYCDECKDEFIKELIEIIKPLGYRC